MRESLAVAAAMNIQVAPAGGGKLDYDAFLSGSGLLADIKRHRTIRRVGFKYRRIKASRLQSSERGHRTEIDYLDGYICDHGAKRNVPTPVNDAARKVVREIEAGQRKMSMDNLDAPALVPG